MPILSMMKVDTGLAILDDSGSDLMKKDSFQYSYNVTAFCAKTLQNTAFSGRISERQTKMTGNVTILCMTRLHTELVSLDDSGSHMMKNH